MKTLFVGNSLTRGSIGVNFVDLIRLNNPQLIITNAGINGNTLKNIHDKIVVEIDQFTRYDYFVIEAGHNDIVLPLFQSKGILFRLALKYLLKKGRRPLELSDFKTEYAKMIAFVQSKTNAKIILATLSCIGENLDSEPNVKREKFNNSIREIANEYGCLVSDIGSAFNEVLKTKVTTNYLLDNFFNSVYFDAKFCKGTKEADELSRRRNLNLTIDGIHLNSKGAGLYKETIEKTLKMSVANNNKKP